MRADKAPQLEIKTQSFDQITHTVFIDESGDYGIKKIRTQNEGGASRYMVLGGVLVAKENADKLRDEIRALEKVAGVKLHSSELKHHEKVFFANKLSSLKLCKLFGVISLKETLAGYGSDIEFNHAKYYNKCAQYLLEIVCQSLVDSGCEKETLFAVLEKAENLDYSALRNLISKCQDSPMHRASHSLKQINPTHIRTKSKDSDPLLRIADLCAHVLYKCVDDHPRYLGVREPRYLLEMSDLFHSNKEGIVVGKGIKPVHELEQLQLTSQILSIFGDLDSK